MMPDPGLVEMLDDVLAHVSDAVALSTEDGHIVYLSPQGLHSLGYTREQFGVRSAAELVHPDDFEETMLGLALRWSTSVEAPGAPFRVRAADGQWLEVVAQTSARKVGGYLPVVLRQTSAEQLEASLARQMALERFMFELFGKMLALEGEPEADFLPWMVAEVGSYLRVGVAGLCVLDDNDSEVSLEIWRAPSFTGSTETVERLLAEGPSAGRPDDLPSLVVDPVEVGRFQLTFAAVATAANHQFLPDNEQVASTVVGLAGHELERRRQREETRVTEARYRSLIENGPAVVARFDRDVNLTFFAGGSHFPLDFAPHLGTPLVEQLDPPFDVEELDRRVRYVIEQAKPTNLEIRSRSREGTAWLELRLVPELDHLGRVDQVLMLGTDGTARHRAEQRLQFSARHDPLTGLLNRAAFNLHLEGRLRDDGESLAVIFLDLDRFKLVNDSLGHSVGDELLCAVADRLGRLVRGRDVVARFGGDEFMILIEEVGGEDGRDHLVGLVERIREAIAQPFDLGEHEVHMTASLGIAFGHRNAERPDQIVADADVAMYEAKEAGRNRYELFDEDLRAEIDERLRTESALRRTLEEDGLAVYYQPQVDLESGRIVGAEALVRWPGEDRVLPAAEFVDLAEETQLIVEVGRWVLERTCGQLSGWQGSVPDGWTVSVNLSARQLDDPSLVERVATCIEHHALDPSWLVLEITETVLMRDPTASVILLEQLREIGVGLAIDDFGTGYSSLSQLKNFPVDRLKIDREFVAGLADDPRDRAIVESILGLADALDLLVVAEGVESARQVEVLTALGCGVGQGYLFSPALPDRELELLLRRSGIAGPVG